MKNGFTLIELLVVVLMIGILSAIALPYYQRAVLKSRFTQVVTAGKSFKDAMEVYYLANGDYPQWWREVDIEYAACTESSSSRFMLYCKPFAADLFGGANETLTFYDTSLTPDPASLSHTEIARKAQFSYTVWLDRSPNPGKTECFSTVVGFCKSLGY